MKINTTVELMDATGQKAILFNGQALTLGKALVTILSMERLANIPVVKATVLAIGISASVNGEFEIDMADLDMLITGLENSQTFGPIVPGRILLILKDLQAKEKP